MPQSALLKGAAQFGKLRAATKVRPSGDIIQSFRRNNAEAEIGVMKDLNNGFEELFETTVDRVTREKIQAKEAAIAYKNNDFKALGSAAEEYHDFQAKQSKLQFQKGMEEEHMADMQRLSWKRKGEIGDAEARAAIQKYTSGPSGELNKYLHDKAAGIPTFISKRTEETMLGWDRALNKISKPFEEDKTIYRGVSLEELDEFVLEGLSGGPVNIKEGAEFTFAGHTSFSFDENTAKSFSMSNSTGEQSYLFVMDNARGAKGIDINKRTQELTGLGPSEMEGQPLIEAVNHFNQQASPNGSKIQITMQEL